MSGKPAQQRGLTIEVLKSRLIYSPDSGQFTCRHAVKGGPREGEIAGWTTDSRGYRAIVINYKKHYAHNLAWFYMTGEWPTGFVDHKDNDKSNNRWSNLRMCTWAQNNRNKPKRADPRHKSIYLGVRRDDRNGWTRWQARATLPNGGGGIHLGVYATEIEAAIARDKFEKSTHGEFAKLNFTEEQ